MNKMKLVIPVTFLLTFALLWLVLAAPVAAVADEELGPAQTVYGDCSNNCDVP